MNKKKIITGVFLVLGLGVSIYLWSTVGLGEDKGDPTVSGKPVTYTCVKCQKTFTLTVAEAGAMRRANEGQIVCPECHTAGAQKHDVVVSVGGDGGFKPPDDGNSTDQPQDEPVAERKPKVAGSGMQKKED